ncbi:MAG: hypothetical protein J2P25_03360 [Nocardiopsaceae bacterium]|nr:hypothetical protein [Nocardiopsaceae bacterium]
MFRELDDRWILNLRGEHVDSVVRSAALVIYLDGGAEITVSGDALVSKGSIWAPGSTALRVADMTDEELQELAGSTVFSAVAFKSGSLRIVFSTAHHLNVCASNEKASARVRQPGSYEWSCHDQSVEMVVHDS